MCTSCSPPACHQTRTGYVSSSPDGRTYLTVISPLGPSTATRLSDTMYCDAAAGPAVQVNLRPSLLSTDPLAVTTYNRKGAPCSTRSWAPTRPLRASARPPTRTPRKAGSATAGRRPGWRQALLRALGRGCNPWLVLVCSASRCGTVREQGLPGLGLASGVGGAVHIICTRASGSSARHALSAVCAT